jgi:hypothetical protein
MFNVFQQLLCHILWLIAIGMRFQKIREEKELKHHEDNKQFDENDDPKRLTKRHRAEPIVIQMEHLTEKVVLTHADCCKMMWQIYIFYSYVPNI